MQLFWIIQNENPNHDRNPNSVSSEMLYYQFESIVIVVGNVDCNYFFFFLFFYTQIDFKTNTFLPVHILDVFLFCTYYVFYREDCIGFFYLQNIHFCVLCGQWERRSGFQNTKHVEFYEGHCGFTGNVKKLQ